MRAKALTRRATDFESVVENLEDAVALFNPEGGLMFCNPAMGTVLPQFASAETVADDMAAGQSGPSARSSAHSRRIDRRPVSSRWPEAALERADRERRRTQRR